MPSGSGDTPVTIYGGDLFAELVAALIKAQRGEELTAFERSIVAAYGQAIERHREELDRVFGAQRGPLVGA